MSLLSSIGGAVSGAISSVSQALGITKKPTQQLGSVYIKPNEVSQVTGNTPVTVVDTSKSTSSLIPSGNIQNSLSQNISSTLQNAPSYSQTQTNIPAATVPGTTLSSLSKRKYLSENGISFDTAEEAMAYNQRVASGNMTAADISRENQQQFGAFAPVATGLDFFTTAFAHPFQVAGAAIDPNKSISDVVNKFYNEPLGTQILDTALAGATYITTVLGINSLLAATAAKGTAMAAGTAIEGDIAKAAAGDFIRNEAAQIGVSTVKAGTIAVNTATAAQKIGYLAQLAAKAKNPAIVLGAIGTYMFSTNMAMNEKGDAVMALEIAIGQAQKNGDIEGARKMKEYLDDITDPSILNTLKVVAPILNYPLAAITKWESTKMAADITMEQAEKDYAKSIANAAMEQKINAGLATDAEVEQYAKDNPYSNIAALYKQMLTNQQYSENAIALQQQLEDIKTAGTQARQDIYDASKSSTSDGTTTYEPQSALNFGLLHSAGGYETTGTKPPTGSSPQTQGAGENQDVISNYLFGVPYRDLTAEQKAVVDKW